MSFYLCGQNGCLVYLLQNRQYTVGRKDCDILISNDQSISRKHAILKIKDNKVILRDCGSRYNTFVDEAKLEAETEVTIMHGNVIKFGRLQSVYTFNERAIITTTSSIKTNQKLIFKQNIDFLGGSIVQNWNQQCTHVTTEQILLTVKVLCAIIQGTPIVNLKYWDDYVECVKQNLRVPDCKNYMPPCSEMLLNYHNISLEYREERKSLFKNKVFIFPTEVEKARMVDMIKLAGGETISFDTNPITISVIKDSSKEYLVMVTDTPPSNPLQDIITYVNELGKRTVPLQEIALAIITCSCEKDCNPNFDRKGTVLEAKTQTQKHTANILATETQSQVFFAMESENVKTETVIPTSMEFIEPVVVDNPQNVSVREWLKSVPSIEQVKREGDSMEDINAAKKIKIEETPVPLFSKSRQKKEIVKNSPDTKTKFSKEESKPSGRSLFAFKKDKSHIEHSHSGSKTVVINPFARKRKATENEDENLPKRSIPIDDTLDTQLPSKVKSVPVAENPFANILKSNTPSKTTPKASVLPFKPTLKKAQNIVASSTLIHDKIVDLQVDISAIGPDDTSLEKSCAWISKSNANSTVHKPRSKVNGFADEVEEELTKYIESFKNTVVIEEESMVVKKPIVLDNNNDSSAVNNNFKTFKKVKPLRIQTTIIPEARYAVVICNEKSSIPVVAAESEDDESDLNTQVNTGRRKGKRFNF